MSGPVPLREMPASELRWDAPDEPSRMPARASRVVHALDVLREPAPVEIVEGLAWAGCITVLVAESGAGKTFVLLDVAAAISSGFSWHGRGVTQGSVVYVSFEGDAIGLRLRALHEHRRARLEHVYTIRAINPISPILSREGEMPSIGEHELANDLNDLQARLTAEGRPSIVLVVIDTVRASLTGSEDGSEAVSAYLRAARRILGRVPDAALILAHHAGWQDGDAARKRERGSSAWRGNVDATLYLEAGTYDPTRESATLTLTAKKVRDGEPPPELHLTRQRVHFDEKDRHGKPVTSCVIDPDGRTAADRAAEQEQATQTKQLSADLSVLRTMRDQTTVTNIHRLQPYVGLKYEAVSASVARVIRAGWAIDGGRGKPYTITDAGAAALNGGPK